MNARYGLSLAGLAVAGALLVDATGGPSSARLALQIIAGVLGVLVMGPALLRRWPEDPPRPGDVDPVAARPPAPRRPVDVDAGELVDQ